MDAEGLDQLVAIPEAPAKWALVAPPVWLAFHRLWWPLVVYGLFVTLCLVLLATNLALVALILMSLPGLYLLLEGRQLRINSLEDRGFHLSGIVDADCETSAIAHYLDRNVAGTATATPANSPVFRPASGSDRADDAIGLFAAQE